MGNNLFTSKKKRTKVMKINGETMKLNTPLKAMEVLNDYPGHVLLDSESVKHHGIRGKPLEPHHNLEPKRVYFLVELPKLPPSNAKITRRVHSAGINMSAKDRLESLMLSRRSNSDLSAMRSSTNSIIESSKESLKSGGSSSMKLKLRLPKGDVERLMRESRDEEDAASKIVDLYLANTSNRNDEPDDHKGKQQQQHQVHRRSTDIVKKASEKRIGFLPNGEANRQVAVAF